MAVVDGRWRAACGPRLFGSGLLDRRVADLGHELEQRHGLWVQRHSRRSRHADPSTARAAGARVARRARCARGRVSPSISPTALFEAQLQSRHLDHAARWLRAKGKGYYTIGSAGPRGQRGRGRRAAAHRPGAAALPIGRVLPGARRAVRQARTAGVRDVLPGCCARGDEPIAGGRHKVFGHPDLAIIPQTSTIASHLPRAVGVAFAIERARSLGAGSRWPDDAIAVCSFGDASINHSTAQGALNTAVLHRAPGAAAAAALRVRGQRPGASACRRRARWVREAYALARPGLRYFAADGCDLADAYDVATELAEYVRPSAEAGRAPPAHRAVHGPRRHRRRERLPQRRVDPRRLVARDPLLGHGAAPRRGRHVQPRARRALPRPADATCAALAIDLAGRRTLETAAEVMAPLSPRRPQAVASRVAGAAPADERRSGSSAARCPRTRGRSPSPRASTARSATCCCRCRTRWCSARTSAVKGGVYGVTRGLQKKAGAARVFDTLLDEQSILGLALGAGVSGLLPIPEIQYLAYLHNAEDQLRGEAASLSFFSNGRSATPWWCASPASRTRRGSAVTSTTTTRSRCCATSPAW
jgi:2-oxoisovalerate dehydrogenase E1 component